MPFVSSSEHVTPGVALPPPHPRPAGRRNLLVLAVAIAVVWAASRAWLLLTTMDVLHDPWPLVTTDVSQTYHNWYTVLRSGHFPSDDVMWQYPPGAAGILLLPGLLPWSYTNSFFVLMVVADFAAFACLMRGVARGAASPWGAILWVVAVPLLGPMILSRYDLAVTAIAIAALTVSGFSHRHRLSGFLIGVGTMVKIWPGLLLFGVPRGKRLVETLLWTVIGGAMVALGFSIAMPGSMSFLGYQKDRGIEIESVASMPFHIARLHGWTGHVEFHYGSLEFLGPHIELASRITMGASLLAFAWLLWWRVRSQTWTQATPYDAALTAVLLFTVTSRVISPQYMVWLIGLAAVCLTRRETSQRIPALLIVIATPLTTWEFPVWFGWLMAGETQAIQVLFWRNCLLILATVVSCVRLWRSTRGPALPTTPPGVAVPFRLPDAG